MHGRHRTAAPTLRRVRSAAYAAIDLGTNNCRLLIARATADGFKVVDGFSSMVRLGEGVASAGRFSPAARARTIDALTQCAEKVAAWAVPHVRCVATAACRNAVDAEDFLEEVQTATGFSFEIIDAVEEARLAVLGCAGLIGPGYARALVVDIGGGSTELSLVDATRAHEGAFALEPLALQSLPFGVVALAERMRGQDPKAWFEPAVAEITQALSALEPFAAEREAFAAGRNLLVGASGTMTSLAGVHLDLPRYVRARVDGLWMTAAHAAAAIERLRGMDEGALGAHPCIGPGRADLVLPGAAILEGVLRVCPAPRLRVADRGLREGMLMLLRNEHPP